MPSFSGKHSSASAKPVEIAIFGMSPSVRFFGSRVSAVAIGRSAHAATFGMTS
jgi:hypothetical protein